LLTSAGYGVRIEAKEVSQNGIATVSQLHGLQSGEQATLLLVEQAIEKQNGGLKFVWRYLESGSICHQRNRQRSLSGAELLSSLPTIGGRVQETSGQVGAAQSFCAHQIVEGIMDFGMKQVGQFVGEATARGLIDESLDGGDQSAIAGKPNVIVGPQACVVEAGSFEEGIVATAMRIAGKVIQELELAKNGQVGASAESAFELGQGCDFVAEQVLAEG